MLVCDPPICMFVNRLAHSKMPCNTANCMVYCSTSNLWTCAFACTAIFDALSCVIVIQMLGKLVAREQETWWSYEWQMLPWVASLVQF